MRPLTTSLALAAVAGTLHAQIDNEMVVFSGVTSLATRSRLQPASRGEVCVRFPGAFFAGIGQTEDPVSGRPVNRVSGMRYVIQDQDAGTGERYEIGIKGSDPLAPTQVDPTRDLVRISSLRTPATTSGFTIAWIFTTTFATPFDGVPAQGDVWPFVQLSAAPNWPADGSSLHASAWPAPSGAPIADTPNARATLLPLMNAVDQTAIQSGTPPQSAVTASTDHIARIWMTTPGVVLAVGSDVAFPAWLMSIPNFGVGGMYPDHGPGRRDGLALLVKEWQHVPSWVVVLGAFGGPRNTPPTPLSSILTGGVGGVYLRTPLLSSPLLSAPMPPTGRLQTVPFPQPMTVPGPIGRMSFQAFLLDARGRLRASNVAGFDSQ